MPQKKNQKMFARSTVTLAISVCLATGAAMPHSTHAAEPKPANALDDSRITEQMLYVDDPEKWSRPATVLPPVFPPDQLEAKATGYVDIEVAVGKSGRAEAVRIVESVPPNKAFENAVNDVVTKWRFRPRIDVRCMPQPNTTRTRIWFDIRDGAPVISVSGRVSGYAVEEKKTADSPDKAPAKTPAMLNRNELGLRYPERMRRANVQAYVYTVMTVSAKTGTVADVAIADVQLIGYSTGAEAVFGETARSAMAKAKFEPRETADYRACMPVYFQFSN